MHGEANDAVFACIEVRTASLELFLDFGLKSALLTDQEDSASGTGCSIPQRLSWPPATWKPFATADDVPPERHPLHISDGPAG